MGFVGRAALPRASRHERSRARWRRSPSCAGASANADETVSDWELRDLWDEAQFELGKVRLFGDLVLAAFFEGEKPKETRGEAGREYASAVVSGEAERYRGWLEEWRYAEQPLAPFHWEIEFPEVFDREIPASMRLWATRLSGGKELGVGHGQRSKLSRLAEAPARGGSHGNADLVAHFFPARVST